MEYLSKLIYLIIFPGFIFTMLVGLFLSGLDRKVVARMQRRRGPKITQPFYDFVKLLGKDTIVPRNSNERLFIISPIIALVSICIIPTLFPIYDWSFFGGTADIVVIIYLLIIPAVAMIVGGMASGSPFASIGVSREVVAMVAYELPLITSLLAVCKKAGLILGEGTTYSLSAIASAQQSNGSFIFTLSLIPAAIAFLMILPAKIGVAPFDVAEAETELCEGPLAEYSGLHLGLFKLTHNIKIYVMTALFVVLFLGGIGITTGNRGIDLLVNTIILIILVIVISIMFLSIVRGLMGRYKTNQMFKFYWTVPTILSLLSYVLVSFNL
ncbi:complex I subunit 1 family protein [Clostridium sp. D53t1_180928_C8]|uniref:respiratory chain complex I subunit 1 family protein n=1 Tax=Clostridium sp. D53t1_180928_C8 TaxID=2787101 RepID=UPI0018AA85D1|nr:complex I subunit 1 family protein [Clostridium sp. D53t1_180928_C8]